MDKGQVARNRRDGKREIVVIVVVVGKEMRRNVTKGRGTGDAKDAIQDEKVCKGSIKSGCDGIFLIRGERG